MSEIVDAAWLREVGYAVVGLIAAIWAVREHVRPPQQRPDWWPAYWWTSAILLVAMGGARVGSLEVLVEDFGREQARAGGWYESRRNLQGLVVLVLGGVWLVGVLGAIWRVPPRRRRYLPHAIGVSGLMAFAAVRVVSFHYVDALLYRRGIGGVRFVSIIELGVLAATALAGMATARFPRRDAVDGRQGASDTEAGAPAQ